MTIPLLGHVIVVGYLAATIISGIESAVTVGALSALGAALFSIGIPEEGVVRYEAAVKADNFLVMARSTAEETARATSILATHSPSRIDIHVAGGTTEKVEAPVLAHA